MRKQLRARQIDEGISHNRLIFNHMIPRTVVRLLENSGIVAIPNKKRSQSAASLVC